MAFLVEAPVDGFVACAGGVLRDLRRGHQPPFDEMAQIVGIMGGVRHDVADADKAFDQAARRWAIPDWPGVSAKRIGKPGASTAAWILVVNQP